MQKVINNNPNDIDAYLSMTYLLMNLLVEEDYSSTDHDFYADLLKKYFIESRSKFSKDPKYLFYIGMIACMSEWYFDISMEEAESIIKESGKLEPDNLLYQWGYYGGLAIKNKDNKEERVAYALEVLAKNSIIREMLKLQGALGIYILKLMEHWSKNEITN
jgi:hypothetical protein